MVTLAIREGLNSRKPGTSSHNAIVRFKLRPLGSCQNSSLFITEECASVMSRSMATADRFEKQKHTVDRSN